MIMIAPNIDPLDDQCAGGDGEHDRRAERNDRGDGGERAEQQRVGHAQHDIDHGHDRAFAKAHQHSPSIVPRTERTGLAQDPRARLAEQALARDPGIARPPNRDAAAGRTGDEREGEDDGAMEDIRADRLRLGEPDRHVELVEAELGALGRGEIVLPPAGEILAHDRDLVRPDRHRNAGPFGMFEPRDDMSGVHGGFGNADDDGDQQDERDGERHQCGERDAMPRAQPACSKRT